MLCRGRSAGSAIARGIVQQKVFSAQFRSVPRLGYPSASEGVQAPDYLDAGERKVFGLLKDGLNPIKLEVQDISGGCGSTYALDIVSDKFSDLSILQQHRLVKQVLAEEFKKWHGIQLKTSKP